MVTKEPVLTENAPPPMGGLLSQGIVANGFIFTSGAIAQDPQTGEIVSEDIEEQTNQCIRNLQAILEAAGSSLEDVVEVTIYMPGPEKFSRMNNVYRNYWGDVKPARTTIFMSAMPPGALVEMKCTALVR